MAARRQNQTGSNIASQMIDGVVAALWIPAWANFEEEQGRSFSGQRLEDVAPAPPASVRRAARAWTMKLVQLNKKTLNSIYGDASRAEGYPVDANELGYYLAMQSLGHGVGWGDSHEEFPVRLPHVEAYVTGRRGRSYDFYISGV